MSVDATYARRRHFVRGKSISRGSQRPLRSKISKRTGYRYVPLRRRQDHNLDRSFFYVWSTHTLCVTSRRDTINYRRQPFEKTLDIDREKSIRFSRFKKLWIL